MFLLIESFEPLLMFNKKNNEKEWSGLRMSRKKDSRKFSDKENLLDYIRRQKEEKSEYKYEVYQVIKECIE